MTKEIELWLRLHKEHQRRADVCSRKVRDLHRERAKSHPHEYIKYQLVVKG